jgi:hypothetical protein
VQHVDASERPHVLFEERGERVVAFDAPDLVHHSRAPFGHQQRGVADGGSDVDQRDGTFQCPVDHAHDAHQR